MHERRHGPVHVIHVDEVLDAGQAPALSRRVRAAWDDGVRAFVVDLGDLRLLPSTGVGALLQLVAELRPEGGRVALVCSAPGPRSTLRTLGADALLRVHDTLDGALAALTP